MMNKTFDWLTGLGHSPKKPRSLRMFVATQGPVDVSVHVLVPFEEMVSFNTLMESIKQAKCPFYIGHFQSGKTSALRYLAQIKPAWIYIDSNCLGGTIRSFLDGISKAMMLSGCKDMNSLYSEIEARYTDKTVLMFDEFDHFLKPANRTLLPTIYRLLKLVCNRSIQGILSVVCAGSFALVDMMKETKVSQDERELYWNLTVQVIVASDITAEQHKVFFTRIQKVNNLQFEPDVVSDVFSRTQGYAGLEGLLALLCIEFAVNMPTLTMKEWTTRFQEFIQQHSSKRVSILQHILRDLESMEQEVVQCLEQFLEFGEMPRPTINDDKTELMFGRLRALGIIVERGSKYEFTSNIVLDLLSNKYYPVPQHGVQRVASIPDAAGFLQLVVESLAHIRHQTVFHRLAANAGSFSEYIIQGEIFALLRATVPYPRYNVFRETRTLPDSKKKCDVWVCNGQEYGIECKVGSASSAAIKIAANQAIRYTKGHDGCVPQAQHPTK
ncbi:hypothetical protein BC937DRAFT_86827 [Endogone sp. FLAS-F59071]|nr:hypothetical protein BC937DRAFT_86827 [Endogone sp. FLAS-F59071]|eukprot:RUS22791.1 hypothetical protein BC937DRAFT_86827 [Endogone sp. FLAS-F59071]